MQFAIMQPIPAKEIRALKKVRASRSEILIYISRIFFDLKCIPNKNGKIMQKKIMP